MGYFGTCSCCGVANDCRYKYGRMFCEDCLIEWEMEFCEEVA